MDIRIEEITTAQIPVIQELADQVFMVTYRGIHSDEQNAYMMGLMYSTESLTRQMCEEGSRFLLVHVDGAPVGYCAFKPYSGDEHGEGPAGSVDTLPVVYLDKFYLIPGYQGLGIGKKLMAEVILESRRLHPGGCIVRLDVNKSNRAKLFYERQGFVKVRYWDAPIGQGFYMNGCTMDLRLEPDNRIEI